MNTNHKSKNWQKFEAISNFVEELQNILGKKYRPLSLFQRFLSNVTVSDSETILKIVKLFKDFCVENNDMMVNMDMSLVVNKEISYSDNVRINIDNIFNLLDTVSKVGFWRHMLTIYALTSPKSNARDVLQTVSEEEEETIVPSSDHADKFLNDIFVKVEGYIQNCDEKDDPLKIVGDMMQQGVFTDILTSFKDNSENLDMSQMMSSITSKLLSSELSNK
jgi:hypothetical protein